MFRFLFFFVWPFLPNQCRCKVTDHTHAHTHTHTQTHTVGLLWTWDRPVTGISIQAPMVVFLFNTVIYVFLLLCVCILIVWLPWLRFFRAFSSVVRQMPGHNSPRRSTARTLPKFWVVLCIVCLCRSVYCLCVNVYCTTATGCQPNCS